MSVTATLEQQVRAKHLLDHPFYQRWNAGELTIEELREYAAQYYHYTKAFPTFVSAVHANSDDMVVRQALLENLIEEERGEENHPELWLRFCDALGMDRDEVKSSTPNAETEQLIRTMRTLTREGGVHEGLAALYAYESQVPAVSKNKIEGLAKFYQIDEARAVSFFSVHMEADVYHAQTSEQLLTSLCDSSEKEMEASAAAEATLEALYGFLHGVNSEASAMVH